MRVHRVEELAIGLGVAQLVEQEVDRIHGAHRIEDAAQDVHLLQHGRLGEQLFLARAGARDVDAPSIRTARAADAPEETIAEDIEFTFYMNVIHDLDFHERVVFEDSGLGRSVRTRKTRLGSIDASPGSSNYPKYQTIYGGAGHEHVAFDKFGDVLRERVDELHKKRFNKIPFFLHDETISENTITRAEQKLAELSNVNLRTLAGPPPPTTPPATFMDLKRFRMPPRYA